MSADTATKPDVIIVSDPSLEWPLEAEPLHFMVSECAEVPWLILATWQHVLVARERILIRHFVEDRIALARRLLIDECFLPCLRRWYLMLCIAYMPGLLRSQHGRILPPVLDDVFFEVSDGVRSLEWPVRSKCHVFTPEAKGWLALQRHNLPWIFLFYLQSYGYDASRQEELVKSFAQCCRYEQSCWPYARDLEDFMRSSDAMEYVQENSELMECYCRIMVQLSEAWVFIPAVTKADLIKTVSLCCCDAIDKVTLFDGGMLLTVQRLLAGLYLAASVEHSRLVFSDGGSLLDRYRLMFEQEVAFFKEKGALSDDAGAQIYTWCEEIVAHVSEFKSRHHDDSYSSEEYGSSDDDVPFNV
ncbi:MAG: hypothetical protein QG604_906 [Candidatus Dependentiae bacterium]|nr:hypothetical protein [Candidatus Dependentiae bacterium]